jgi:hypothetical protein
VGTNVEIRQQRAFLASPPPLFAEAFAGQKCRFPWCFGAAHAIRQRMGSVCFKVWDAGYEASMKALRDTLGRRDRCSTSSI